MNQFLTYIAMWKIKDFKMGLEIGRVKKSSEIVAECSWPVEASWAGCNIIKDKRLDTAMHDSLLNLCKMLHAYFLCLILPVS